MPNENMRALKRAATMVLLSVLLAQAATARAAGIVVTSTADSTANDGQCTLREAIINTNADAATWPDCAAGSGADAITFKLGGTIRLGSALPNITAPAGLTIDGAGQMLTISGDTNGTGAASVPIFIVDPGAALAVQNLTLSKGNAGSGYGGAIYNNQGTVTVIHSTLSGNQATCGGAVANDNGTLTVADSVFSGNGTSGCGGAIASGGTLSITRSTFSGNSASGNGDGGAISGGGSVTINSSTFADNSTAGNGWGGALIHNGGTLVVTNSTFSANRTLTIGGGIANNWGTLTVTNSTFARNHASDRGGGIFVNVGTLLLTNGTFVDNVSDGWGDSVYNNNGIGTGTVTIRNAILADRPTGGNCGGSVLNGGHNLDSGTSCSWAFQNGSLSSTDPRLNPLADNGGPTPTMALQPTSPAIDAGDPALCALAPPNGPGGLDQRGVPHKGSCDIGAFEFGMKLSLPLILN